MEAQLEMEICITDDRFVCDSGNSDLTLIIEDHRLPVHKTVLAVASPVFRAMFESDFKEKDQQEIELPGKKFEDFVEFLSCLYPNHLTLITRENVYEILPLATEYQVKPLEKRCAEVLMEAVTNEHTSDAEEIYRHILLANLYKFYRLRSACIVIYSDFKLNDLEEAGSTYPITDKDLLEIHHLARKKHELDKKDDRNLKEEHIYLTAIKNRIKSCSTYKLDNERESTNGY